MFQFLSLSICIQWYYVALCCATIRRVLRLRDIPSVILNDVICSNEVKQNHRPRNCEGNSSHYNHGRILYIEYLYIPGIVAILCLDGMVLLGHFAWSSHEKNPTAYLDTGWETYQNSGKFCVWTHTVHMLCFDYIRNAFLVNAGTALIWQNNVLQFRQFIGLTQDWFRQL